jgi:hypothetical protein
MKRILTIAGVAALAACASGTAGPGPSTGSGTGSVAPPAAGASAAPAGSAAAAAGTITAGDMRRHVAYLASDALRGRDTPSPGLDSAAAYLAREFARLGLQGGVDQGGFIQRYPLRGRPGVMAPNVVAIFPGGDPTLRNEYVVLSAHMDHVGVGRPVRGDSIYNGADDDGSGSVAVLEVARALARGPAPRRTVLFFFATGEELGMLGTRWYLQHPVVPLDSTVAGLMIEMIGRPDPLAGGPGRAWLTGYERSTVGQILAGAGVPIVPDPRPDQDFFNRSDNTPFALLGVPAHALSSFGLHGDYHQPSDETERIDWDHMTRVVQAAVDATRALADGPRPQWAPGGRPSRN